MGKEVISYDISSLQDLEEVAKKLASLLKNVRAIIYLTGDLGAGKTTLVQRILKRLGFSGNVKSPTYTYVESYELDTFTLHHFDLYRIAEPSELEYIGIGDYFSEDSTVIIEWPSLGEGEIPDADIEITINLDDERRTMMIQLCSSKVRELLR